MRRCWFCVFETPSLITSLDVLTACICSLSPDEVFTFPTESAGLSLDSMCPSPVSPMSCNSFTVHDNIVYQDNQSTMLLGNNGRHSSGKKTRHIKIRYYFITDHIRRQNIQLAYCPTEEMISDFFTKPLQGSQFRKFRDFILNVDHGVWPVGTQECVGTSGATTESRVEPDGSSVCPAPSPSMPRSYAQVAAGATTSDASGSLVRSQSSEVNFRRSC